MVKGEKQINIMSDSSVVDLMWNHAKRLLTWCLKELAVVTMILMYRHTLHWHPDASKRTKRKVKNDWLYRQVGEIFLSDFLVPEAGYKGHIVEFWNYFWYLGWGLKILWNGNKQRKGHGSFTYWAAVSQGIKLALNFISVILWEKRANAEEKTFNC